MPSTPTVFLSAATIDLKEWRDVLHDAFSRAGFRVLTQDRSLGSALQDVKSLLIETIAESDCIVHLAGMGYGADAQAPFPDAPAFQCSWTQFEYYHAHREGKNVIAFVCAPNLSKPDFVEEGGDAADIARKQHLQEEHRRRVASGKFEVGLSPVKLERTSNETVDSFPTLLKAVAAAVGTLHRLDQDARAKAQLEFRDLTAEWRTRMERQERQIRRLRPIHLIGAATILLLLAVAFYFGQKERQHARTTQHVVSKLDNMERMMAKIASDKNEKGQQISDIPREQLQAELAQRAGITLDELQRLLAEAAVSKDDSIRAQGLIIQQQFEQAAVLARKAGDAKAGHLKAMQSRTVALAEEAALDYEREGLAYYYQRHFPDAIAAYEAALAQITRSSHPGTWAKLQIDLGDALDMRSTSSESEAELELQNKAETAYRAALEVYTRNAHPQEWAATQCKIADVRLRQLYVGGAVAHYRAALEIWSHESQPQEWARTQLRLATALSLQSVLSEWKAALDLLRQATIAQRDGKKTLAQDAVTECWANFQTRLAGMLQEQGERTKGQTGPDIVKQILAAYESAVEMHRKEVLPQQWAATQNQLGMALETQGDKVADEDGRQQLYREAETAYLAALEVRTNAEFTDDCEETTTKLTALRAKMPK